MRKADVHSLSLENGLFAQELSRLLQQDKQRSVTFTVRGYSMRPFIENERDKVVIEAPRAPEVGQVVFAEVTHGAYVLHRIIAIDGSKIILQGDGNSLKTTEITSEDKIIGTAKAFIRKGRYVSVESPQWRRYSAFWAATRALRALLLAIYRIKKHIL